MNTLACRKVSLNFIQFLLERERHFERDLTKSSLVLASKKRPFFGTTSAPLLVLHFRELFAAPKLLRMFFLQ